MFAQVVLLDEFTSALDEATERDVIDKLRPFFASGSARRTVIAIAHHSRVFDALGVTRVITLGPRGSIVSDEERTPQDERELLN
jgi:ABC-type bacteriocin/lantibiotic exporter with double-glycine peptidase domain